MYVRSFNPCTVYLHFSIHMLFIYKKFYTDDYLRDRCIKEMFYCSISDAWRTPQTNHFTTSADSIIYYSPSNFTRDQVFTRTPQKNMRLHCMSYTQSQSLFCYGKQFFFSQISPSVTKSNKLSWKFALILLLLLCRIE